MVGNNISAITIPSVEATGVDSSFPEINFNVKHLRVIEVRYEAKLQSKLSMCRIVSPCVVRIDVNSVVSAIRHLEIGKFTKFLLARLESAYALNERMKKIWTTLWLFCDNLLVKQFNLFISDVIISLT